MQILNFLVLSVIIAYLRLMYVELNWCLKVELNWCLKDQLRKNGGPPAFVVEEGGREVEAQMPSQNLNIY